MKKNYLIYVLLVLIITALIIPSNSITTIKVDKKELKDQTAIDYSKISIKLGIDKRGEDNNYLEDVEFKLNTYNNIYSINSNIENEIYYFDKIYSDSLTSNMAYNILSQKQKNLVDSIKTTDDIYEYFKSNGIGECKQNICYIYLPTIFYLEEISAPLGYAKDKVLIPGIIKITYYQEKIKPPKKLDENSNILKLDDFDIKTIPGAYFKYGEVEIDKLITTKIYDVLDYWKNKSYITDNINDIQCDNINNTILELENLYEAGQTIILQSQETSLSKDGVINQIDLPANFVVIDNNCPITLKNKKGSVNITLDNKVNGLNQATVMRGSKLQYKVTVKNTGNVDAIDNTVTSTLPEGFEYVEGSANNGGKYSEGEVTWNLARIKEKETIELTYEAYVPNNISSIKNYIGTSSLTGFSIEKRIDGEPTRVNVEIINPETSNQFMIIGLTLSIILGLSIYLYLYYKRKKQPKFMFMN